MKLYYNNIVILILYMFAYVKGSWWGQRTETWRPWGWYS